MKRPAEQDELVAKSSSPDGIKTDSSVRIPFLKGLSLPVPDNELMEEREADPNESVWNLQVGEWQFEPPEDFVAGVTPVSSFTVWKYLGVTADEFHVRQRWSLEGFPYEDEHGLMFQIWAEGFPNWVTERDADMLFGSLPIEYLPESRPIPQPEPQLELEEPQSVPQPETEFEPQPELDSEPQPGTTRGVPGGGFMSQPEPQTEPQPEAQSTLQRPEGLTQEEWERILDKRRLEAEETQRLEAEVLRLEDLRDNVPEGMTDQEWNRIIDNRIRNLR